MNGGAPPKACDRCSGIGFVYETINSRERVKPCGCHRGFSAPLTDPLERCRIPPRYHYSLGNFEAQTPTLQNAYRQALAYCDRYPHPANAGLGLLFWGAKGIGKTHLAVGVLRELVANKGAGGRFWDFGALVKEIGRCYEKSSFTTVMDTLRSTIEVDLLLLDDLASRRMPDWVLNTLFEIVNARYMARRPTLITTAFEDVDRDEAVGADHFRREEFLIDRIGQRVRSRLLEMCVFVPMQSPEERKAQREPPHPRTLAGMRRQGPAAER